MVSLKLYCIYGSLVPLLPLLLFAEYPGDELGLPAVLVGRVMCDVVAWNPPRPFAQESPLQLIRQNAAKTIIAVVPIDLLFTLHLQPRS